MTSSDRLEGIRFNRKFLVVKQACRKDTEIAARKTALIAQGITPESRADGSAAWPARRRPGPKSSRAPKPRPSSSVVPRPRRPRPPPARPRGIRITPNPRRPRRCHPSSFAGSAESCRPTNQDRPDPRTVSRDTVARQARTVGVIVISRSGCDFSQKGLRLDEQ